MRILHPVARLALLLALAAPVGAQAAIESSLGSCGSPGPAQGASTSVSSFFTQQLSSGACYAYVSAMSGPGYASVLANAAFDTGEWSSGGLSASGSAGFAETLQSQLVWNGQPADDFGHLIGRARVRLDGSVSATSNAAAGGDFSHTLQWLGLSGLQAMDVNGQPMAMPDNLEFHLVGLTSGFDYALAALRRRRS